MSFPEKAYPDARSYSAAYLEELAAAASRIDLTAFDRAIAILDAALQNDRTIFACGNGGSAAISNHLLCDFSKGVQGDTDLHPKVVSLSAHVELITAIGNDLSFDEIYLFQLKTAARPGDVLLTISSSGNSENIVNTVRWAKENGVGTIALTGFNGGRSADIADVNIHVPATNYGVVEDLHQACMHMLAQYLRSSRMKTGLVAEKQF